METNDIKQIVFLVLIFVAICLMLFLIITLIQNKNLIMSDALSYGMNKHNFTFCSCVDDSGNFYEIRNNTFIKK